MNLVIVESPSKIKTISKYLGDNYKVVSSKGHVRDLTTSGKFGLGVDVDNDFKPSYKTIKGKADIVKSLKKDVINSDKVLLATDPDREGEAISWHLFDALEIEEDKYDRVEFNEITKDVIINAFKHPRKIDMDLVKSQETRRILDRIIGFRLSKLMQSKTGGKSAGRVQSVALKLIVDREREIENFKEEEYWTIDAIFEDFKASLDKYHGKKLEVHNEIEANDIVNSLSKTFNIESVTSTLKNKSSKVPFKTSTLQQIASSKFNFGSTKTMKIAQKLYEGTNIRGESVGLITYMRTDSVRLSNTFTEEAFRVIEQKYGKEYVGRIKKAKESVNTQDAHEGIRPTDLEKTPERIKEHLTPDEYKLYSLIYYRTIASLMSDAKYNSTIATLENNGYTFKANGSVLTFDGYLKVYDRYEKNEDEILPDLSSINSKMIISNDILSEQHFTKPVSRYTEASLIKEMESLGIGRPSTYAKTMDTLKLRNYVIVKEKKFFPTEVGVETTDRLQQYFSDIINVKYTAEMEKELDEIAEAKYISVEVLRKFYNIFEPLVEQAFDGMEKTMPEEVGENCPNCSHPLVKRRGRYGEFIACSNFPECKYIKKEPKEEKILMTCHKCGGNIIEKTTKRKRIFYGCSNYPKCNFASWDKPYDEKCAVCSGTLVDIKGIKTCIDCKKEY